MTPFVDENYIYPEKAKEQLRKALENHQPVYICAKAGFGKTSLVAKYLARRKYLYFDVQNSHMDDMAIPEGEDKIVVFDNLQFLDEDYVQEKIVEIVRKKEVECIFISRARCPGWLADEYYRYDSFATITENSLMLQLEDIRKYYNQRELECITEDDLFNIAHVTRGHGLSLKLLYGEMIKAAENSEKKYVFSDDVCTKVRFLLWDYLEETVYKQWEPKLVEFVMQLSIVDKFTKEMAEAITGTHRTDYYIDMIDRMGNFLTMDNEYLSFDEEVRLCMQRRIMIKYDERRRKELYYNAGHYYRSRGMLIEALNMFEKAGYEKLISEILIENASENPSSGYIYQLRNYYKELAEETVKAHVELMSGLSMIYSIQMNPEKSDYWYDCLKEQAEKMSGYEKKRAKGYIAYLDFALPHRGSKNMIQIFKNAGVLLTNREITVPNVGLTGNAPSLMNGGKDFSEWTKKDREIAATLGKILELVLGNNGAGIVELSLAESFFEKGEGDYEIIRYLSKGQLMADSKGKLEMSYVAIGIMARLHLMNGNVDDAIDIVENFRERAKEARKAKLIDNIDSFLCHLRMYSEDKAYISEWFNTQAPDENEFFTMDRYRYLIKARIYIAMNKYNQAYALLQKLEYYAKTYDRTYVRIQALILLADIEFEQKYGEWKETFQVAIELAEQYKFVRVFSSEGAVALKLLKAEKFVFKDSDYKKKVYDETAMMAEQYPGYMSSQNVIEETIEKNALRILKLQAMGFSNEKISGELSISISTVKYHCKENYRKLGVNGKAAAIAEARKRQLI